MKKASIATSLLILFSGAAGCGKSNSSTPASTPTGPSTPALTRVISITGDLAFGNVVIGTTAKKTFTIASTGTGTLTFTGITGFAGTGTAGLSASPLSGSIAGGSSVVVTLFFTPTLAQAYSTVVTVQCDQTAGAASINFSGTGVTSAAGASR